MGYFDNLTQSPGYKPFMKNLLWMGLAATVVGLILKYAAQLLMGSTVLTCGFGMLCVKFFVSAFETPAGCPQNEEDLQNQPVQTSMWQSSAMLVFVQKLWGWSIAVSLIALLFWLQQWPGWNTMAILGVPVFLIALVLKLICKNHQQ